MWKISLVFSRLFAFEIYWPIKRGQKKSSAGLFFLSQLLLFFRKPWLPNTTCFVTIIQRHSNRNWRWKAVYIKPCKVGCPTTYSCHVDSVLLNSKFEANRSKYWNSKFKYSQIEYSNIFRRTWCFQISFLIFEASKIGRWHFPSLHS